MSPPIPPSRKNDMEVDEYAERSHTPETGTHHVTSEPPSSQAIREDGEESTINPVPPQPVRGIMSLQAPAELPQHHESTLSPEDANKWAPWCFRIHNLDCSTKTSAVAHARSIVDYIPPLTIPPPPFSASKEDISVPLNRIVVKSSNPSAGHNLTSAEITFDTTGFHDGTIDPRCLEAVMNHIAGQGFECEVSTAAGNDRSIFLNYEMTVNESLTASEASQALEHIFAQLNCKLHRAWDFKFNKRSLIARGNCTDVSPYNCANLVAQSPFEGGAGAAFSKLVVTPVRYIQPSYFTTLALFAARDSIHSDDPYARFFHSLAYEYNKSTGATSFITNIRRSNTDGYILLDPSTADLAVFICDRPALNGHFPIRVYDLNASSANFVYGNIEKARKEKMIAYEATKRHEASQTQVEALEDRFLRSEHRTDEQLTQLAEGAKRGFAMIIGREESAGIEVLQAEKRSIEREILKLGPTRSSAQEAIRSTLQEDLKAVDEAITFKNQIRADSNRAFVESNLVPEAFRLAPTPSDRRPLSRVIPATPTSVTGFRSLTLGGQLEERGTKRQKSTPRSTIPRMSSSNSEKIVDVITLIDKYKPSIFVLTETVIFDGPLPALLNAARRKYRLYTTPATADKAAGGITMGVVHTIPSQAESITDRRWKLNLLPIAIQTPAFAGSNTLSKSTIMGTYAPQLGNPESKSFWHTIRASLTPHDRWIVIGDINHTLKLEESTPGNRHRENLTASNFYRSFVDTTGASDLWCLQPEFDITTDHTNIWKNPRDPGDRSLSTIDRIAVGPSLPGGHIETLTDTVRGTTHRPVRSRLPIPVLRTDQWSCTPGLPRLTKPTNPDDPKYEEFRGAISAATRNHPDLSRRIKSQEDFQVVYRIASEVYLRVCYEVFDRPKAPVPPTDPPKSKAERNMIHTIETAKRAIAALKNNSWTVFCHKLTRTEKHSLGLCASDSSTQQDILKNITALRRDTVKKLSRVQVEKLKEHEERQYQRKLDIAINTGSVRKIAPNQAIQIPPLVRDPDRPEEIVHDQKKHIKCWERHFEQVLHREQPPTVDKPWMKTPRSRTFRRESKLNPFEWPSKIDVINLRGLLNRGNKSPSPGPDGWEKWPLARASDEWLEIIVKLMNFSIKKNYFPSVLKENFIIPIYKKGDTIDPNNYRGIVLANLLQVLIATWFSTKLQQYAWDMGFIPDEQIAVQKGTQTADMTNLLSALDGYSTFTAQRFYALKRDQKKGFDYVHGSAWRDASKFFGLPEKALTFDTERSSRVSLKVKARDQVSGPIFTDDQIKQGDPFSPIKYVLVTAMALWWIKDMHGSMGLKVRTARHRNGHPAHSDADNEEMRIQMVAAMDDTIIFASDLRELQILTQAMENFQLSYNMETEWTKLDKTSLFQFGTNSSYSLPETVRLSLPHGRDIDITTTDTREFLRTPINDPEQQGKNLEAIMREFAFPRPGKPLPLSALRKIAQVTLANKIQARLQMHPVTRETATNLSKMVGQKIKSYYLWPYYINASILTAEWDKGGFSFPDFDAMNALWAICHLHRQLNSHNPMIAKAYSIMHATLECGETRKSHSTGHRCNPPFGFEVENWGTSNKPHRSFATWEISKSYLNDNKICILPLRAHENVKEHLDNPKIKGQGASAHKTHIKKHRTLNDFTTIAESKCMKTQILKDRIRDLRMDKTPGPHRLLEWATDGSKNPSDMLSKEKCAMAVIGPLPFSAQMADEHASIQDAEITAVVMAIKLDKEYRRREDISTDTPSTIYTDHLSTVRFVRQLQTMGYPEIPPQVSSRHSLRWLRHTLLFSKIDIQVQHIKAHTDKKDKQSTMNEEADKAAKDARESKELISVPMTMLDKFAIFYEDTGITHADTSTIVSKIWKRRKEEDVFDTKGNVVEYYSKYMMTKARSTFGLQTILQTRSKQLPTPALNMKRGKLEVRTLTRCRRCERPAEIADATHIFVSCQGMRSAIRACQNETVETVTKHFAKKDKEVQEEVIDRHLDLANRLYTDCDLWPNNEALFWKGMLPANFEYDPAHSLLYSQIMYKVVSSTGRLLAHYNRGMV